MFFKRKTKEINNYGFTINMKNELMRSLKKAGVDISDIIIDMKKDNLSLAFYLEKNKKCS